jgi:hypothetical protein
MSQFTIRITDESKVAFLLELLRAFEYVEVSSKSKRTKPLKTVDFFQGAGVLKDREINAQEIRDAAWKRRA